MRFAVARKGCEQLATLSSGHGWPTDIISRFFADSSAPMDFRVDYNLLSVWLLLSKRQVWVMVLHTLPWLGLWWLKGIWNGLKGFYALILVKIGKDFTVSNFSRVQDNIYSTKIQLKFEILEAYFHV